MRLIDSTLECDVLARLGGIDDQKWPQSEAASRRLAGREVLVVDDDAQREFAMGQALQQAGARVRFVGVVRRAALHAGLAHHGGCPYHLVILNLDLPDVQTGGVAGIRRHGFEGPILGVTAASRRGRKPSAFGAGCVATVRLPVDAAELVDHAARAINRHELDAAAAELAEAAARDAESEHLGSHLAAYPHLTTMLEKFVQRLPEQVDRLVEAAQARDLAALADLSERIKQASVRHGFDGFARRASQLHHHADAEADPDQSVETLAAEARELADLCRKLTLRPVGGPHRLPPRA